MDERTLAEIAAWAVLAANAVAGAFAGWRWWLVSPSQAVWPLLRAGQALAVGQAAVAGGLLRSATSPATGCTGSTRCCRWRSG